MEESVHIQIKLENDTGISTIPIKHEFFNSAQNQQDLRGEESAESHGCNHTANIVQGETCASNSYTRVNGFFLSHPDNLLCKSEERESNHAGEVASSNDLYKDEGSNHKCDASPIKLFKHGTLVDEPSQSDGKSNPTSVSLSGASPAQYEIVPERPAYGEGPYSGEFPGMSSYHNSAFIIMPTTCDIQAYERRNVEGQPHVLSSCNIPNLNKSQTKQLTIKDETLLGFYHDKEAYCDETEPHQLSDRQKRPPVLNSSNKDHPDIQQAQQQTQKEQKPHPCSYCDKSFRHSSNLHDHLRTHTGDKPFLCSFCSKAFAQSSTLKRHIRIHTGEKAYVCSFCSKSFAVSANLQRHLKIHNSEKPYVCFHCSKRFKSSQELKCHIRTHTGEKPYTCSFCPQSFSLPGTLQRHMRIHTGEKPYTCSVCDKVFSSSHDLKSHVRTHTGERPYECSYCDKTFSQSSTLRTHVRTHSSDQTHVCALCGKTFAQAAYLKQHSRRVHKEDGGKSSLTGNPSGDGISDA